MKYVSDLSCIFQNFDRVLVTLKKSQKLVDIIKKMWFDSQYENSQQETKCHRN